MSHERPKSVITVIIVGLGNIGSYTASLVARMLGLGVVVLVDKERFQEGDLAGQDIRREDVGRAKVDVIGRRLRQIVPALRVIAHAAAVEDLPLGVLRGTILLGCVDSLRTRLYLAETAWALGACYIDAGVEPESLLARVSTYIPGGDAPCYQCGWEQSDYDAVEQPNPSTGTSVSQAATNGLASLGSLAASLQVIECHKILSGRPAHALNGEELVLDAARHRYHIAAQRRSPHCRFAHQTWRLQTIHQEPGKLTLAKVFALAFPDHGKRPGLCSGRQPTRRELSLRAPGHHFVRMTTCRQCSHRQRILRLVRRLRPSDRTCTRCKLHEMDPLVGDMSERLVEASLSASDHSRTLRSLGFVAGDVFTVAHKVGDSTTVRHFMVDPVPRRKSGPQPVVAGGHPGPAAGEEVKADGRLEVHAEDGHPASGCNGGPEAASRPECTAEVRDHGQSNEGFLGTAVPGGDGSGRRE